MALSDEQKQAIANESRIRVLETKLASLKGTQEVLGSLSKMLSLQATDNVKRMEAVSDELNGVKASAGPGITDEFGERTSIDNAAMAERNIGVAATVQAIKANPSLTADDALAAYTTAALASRPIDRKWLLINPQSLLNEYIANLVERGSIQEASFAALVQWVMTTPSDQLM